MLCTTCDVSYFPAFSRCMSANPMLWIRSAKLPCYLCGAVLDGYSHRMRIASYTTENANATHAKLRNKTCHSLTITSLVLVQMVRSNHLGVSDPLLASVPPPPAPGSSVLPCSLPTHFIFSLGSCATGGQVVSFLKRKQRVSCKRYQCCSKCSIYVYYHAIATCDLGVG